MPLVSRLRPRHPPSLGAAVSRNGRRGTGRNGRRASALGTCPWRALSGSWGHLSSVACCCLPLSRGRVAWQWKGGVLGALTPCVAVPSKCKIQMMMARLRTLLFPDRMAEDTDTLLTAMDRADNPRPAKRSRPTDCVRSRQQSRCCHTLHPTNCACVCLWRLQEVLKATIDAVQQARGLDYDLTSVLQMLESLHIPVATAAAAAAATPPAPPRAGRRLRARCDRHTRLALGDALTRYGHRGDVWRRVAKAVM